MTFGAAVRSCFTQYARFSGRARRSEYWFFALFAFLVYLATAFLVLDTVGGLRVLGLLGVLAILGMILPSLAVTVRRLHDTGRSGAWVLISLIPFGGIVLLVFVCTDSEPYPNRFGPSPKPLAGGHAWAPHPQPPYPAVGYGQPYPAVGYGQPQAPYPQPPYPAVGYGQPQPPYPQPPYPEQAQAPGTSS